MAGTSDRISGSFFIVLGLTMYFFVNPNYIESVDGGNITPSAFPNILSIVIAVCGALLLFKPTSQSLPDGQGTFITAVYVGVLTLGLYAMSKFGFEWVAPVLALAIMLGIGERRVLWLVFGVVAMPALIWFLVSFVLGRALP